MFPGAAWVLLTDISIPTLLLFSVYLSCSILVLVMPFSPSILYTTWSRNIWYGTTQVSARSVRMKGSTSLPFFCLSGKVLGRIAVGAVNLQTALSTVSMFLHIPSDLSWAFSWCIQALFFEGGRIAGNYLFRKTIMLKYSWGKLLLVGRIFDQNNQ